MRRSTLGGLSASTLNARANNPQGEASNSNSNGPPEPQASKPRKSLGAPSTAKQEPPRKSSVGRRTSIYSAGKQEPRPIGEKAYQAACRRKLIAFLVRRGYQHEISDKALTSPSAKDFASIVSFLIREADPNATQAKVEDDLPLLLRRLNYPFRMSKSSLQAAGTPHAWPPVLAALMWLVELMSYDETAEEATRAHDAGDIGASFFETVKESYAYFLAGDDQNCKEVDNKLDRWFADEAESVKSAISSEQQEVDKLTEKLEKLKSEDSPLTLRQAELEEATNKVEELKTSIKDANGRKKEIEREIHSMEEEISKQDNEEGSLSGEADRLEELVKGQEMSAAEAEKWRNRKASLEQERAEFDAKRDGHNKSAEESELSLDKGLNRLESSLKEYSELVHKLKLAPPSSKRSKGMDLALPTSATASQVENLGALNIKQTIKPALAKIKEEWQAKAKESREQWTKLEADLDCKQESLAGKQKEHESLHARVDELKRGLDEGNRASEGRVEELNRRAKEMERAAGEASKEAKEVREKSRRELGEARERKKKEEEAQAQEVASMQAELADAIDKVMEHRHRLQGILSDAHSQCSS